MIIPVVGNPAAAALALMIQKGGTIRLRAAELEPMEQFALLIEPSEKNHEVLHFKTVTSGEVRAMLERQVLEAMQKVAAETAPKAKDGSEPSDAG